MFLSKKKLKKKKKNWLIFSSIAHNVEKPEICSHRKKNCQINSFVSNKNVAFTKFLSKKCESKFASFSHCVKTLFFGLTTNFPNEKNVRNYGVWPN